MINQDIKYKLMKISTFRNFIIIVIAIKLLCMGLFSSEYQTNMFMPFVKNFLSGTSDGNPYQYFFEHSLNSSFPYPPLMLLIESFGGSLVWLAEQIGISSVFIHNILFKLPNLIFDFLGLFFLMKMYPQKRKYIGVLYFASPIILYSTYMHGQLDIIPTVLFFGAIYCLLRTDKNYFYWSIFILSIALLTKFHLFAALPIIFFYISKKYGIKRLLYAIGIISGMLLAVTVPFWSEGFIQNVVFNSEQAVLTKVFVPILNVKIFIPILALVLVYFYFFITNSINKDLLMSFCSLIFSLFLILVPPMPGWFVWIVPFVTIFFVKMKQNQAKNATIFVMLNLFYCIYFIFFKDTGNVDLYFLNSSLASIKNHNETLSNVVFTLLEGLLIYSVYLMYHFGVLSNAFYKRKDTPFTIGITGDSGSGKTTQLKMLENVLGKRNLQYIEGDGDHRWERGDKEWSQYTHLNPKANFIYRQAMDVSLLRKNTTVERTEYDHDKGIFTHGHKIKPNRFIVVCGLHTFYLPQMRDNLDLKIYMDTDENLRRFWKLRRDTASRGYTEEKIIVQMNDRMEDARKFIHPQRSYADFHVRYFDDHLPDKYDKNYQEKIDLEITMSASIDLEPMVEILSKYGLNISYDFAEDLAKQKIRFSNIDNVNGLIPFNQIADTFIPQLDEITTEKINSENIADGLISLLLLLLISEKYRELNNV